VKLLYFAPGQVHTYRFIERFKDEFQVVYVCYGEEPPSGVRTVRMPYTGRFARWTPFLNVSPLRKIIEREKPDVVHAMYILPWGYYASRVVKRPAKLVLSAWGDDVYMFGGRFGTLSSMLYRTGIPLQWNRKAASNFDAGVVECEHTRRRMDELGYDVNKVRVIPWGPDCSVFAPGKRDDGLRERMAPGKELIVGCTRSLGPEYGVDRLIMAAKHMDRNIGIVLIGDGKWRAGLENMARELGVSDRVRFMGKIPHRDLAGYVASFDIMVSPSLSDTVSVALLEGMASGLPVISSDVGGTSEWIAHERNGILLKENAPEEISKWIARLASDARLRKELGARARETVLERGDWRRTSELIAQLYRQL
jgi:glycosyltransferase involved in cell wall biosynthesis